jgi:hypothetical protein
MILMEINIKSDITSGLRIPINLSLTSKINISAFPVLSHEGSFHPLYQQDHPNDKVTVVFSSGFLWIQCEID